MSRPDPVEADLARQLRALGQDLRAARERLGLSMPAAAALSGLSERSLREVEAGRTNLALCSLLRLCWALDLDVAVFPLRHVHGARLVEVPPPGQGPLSTSVAAAAERLGLPVVLDIEAGPPAGRKR